MYRINRENIAPFIAQLYRERKNAEPPQSLLQSWSHLSDEEIDKNLTGLFESWGMGMEERERAIERFLQSHLNPFNEQPPAHPNAHTSIPKKKKISLPLIIFLCLIGLGIAFIAYQYARYISLGRVYAITENIMVRDVEGKEAARMDLFPKTHSSFKSYSSLRVLDQEVYYIQPRGADKEYPCRKVLLDNADFSDFLLRRDEKAHYVNINYIVDDKKEFELYQNAFKDLQTVATDNSGLIAMYRKVIVGSMVQQADLRHTYILSHAENLNNTLRKNTNGYIIIEDTKNKAYTIIAGLSDGKYYQFSGDVSTNTYAKPQIIQAQTEDGQSGPLQGNFRFIRNGGEWKLFDTDSKRTTDYYLVHSEEGYKFVFRDPNEILRQQLEEKAKNIEQMFLQQSDSMINPPVPSGLSR